MNTTTETTTSRSRNRRFTSRRGNEVVVWNERGFARRSDGFVGGTRSVRTWAEVNGVEVDVDPGCSYQAESAVHAAGY